MHENWRFAKSLVLKCCILVSFAPKTLMCQRRRIAAAAERVRHCEPAEAKGIHRAKGFPQHWGALAGAQAGWNEKLSVSLSDETMTRPVERARWDWVGICTLGNLIKLRAWWQGRLKHTLKAQDLNFYFYPLGFSVISCLLSFAFPFILKVPPDKESLVTRLIVSWPVSKRELSNFRSSTVSSVNISFNRTYLELESQIFYRQKLLTLEEHLAIKIMYVLLLCSIY